MTEFLSAFSCYFSDRVFWFPTVACLTEHNLQRIALTTLALKFIAASVQMGFALKNLFK